MSIYCQEPTRLNRSRSCWRWRMRLENSYKPKQEISDMIPDFLIDSMRPSQNNFGHLLILVLNLRVMCYCGYKITRYRPLWDVTIAGPPRCPVWCRLVTVPLIQLLQSQSQPAHPQWAKCRPRNTQNGETIANLVVDSESGSPSSYSRFIVTIDLSCLVQYNTIIV